MFRSKYGHRMSKTTSGTGVAFAINTFEGLFVDYASTGNISDLTACSTTMDGATLAEGKTVMLKDQTVTAENGFYYVDSVSGSSCVLLRLPGFEAGVVLSPGFQVMIGSGSANAGLNTRMTGTAAKTIATDSVSFAAVVSTIEGDSLATRISTSDSADDSADTSLGTRTSTALSAAVSADTSLLSRVSTTASSNLSATVSADTSLHSRVSTATSTALSTALSAATSAASA